MLYVYENTKLQNLINNLSNHDFVSITKYYIKSDNILKLLDYIDGLSTEDIEEVIDISHFFDGTAYSQLFVESYIDILKEYFINSHFSINQQHYEKLITTFPLLFEEEEINCEYRKKSKEKKFELQNLYTYHINEATEISTDKKIIPFSTLWKSTSVDTFLELIKNEKVEYINLSSAIRTINDNQAIILNIEVLIQELSKKYDFKWIVEESLFERTLTVLPNHFIENKNTKQDKDQTEDNKEKNNTSKVDDLLESIQDKLVGHNVFIKEFIKEWKNFTILNKYDVRKLFSVFISGESGVGKTEFARILSNVLYPNDNLIKINFGNYSTRDVLNSLIGSPRGFIGSDTGELTQKISQSDSKVILIDEFEKADSNVFNFFYELLEDGFFTDRLGKVHDLSGYIIVFTSNLGKEEYQKKIPNPLKSRFDMVYYFTLLSVEEKEMFINSYTKKLFSKLELTSSINQNTKCELLKLKQLTNIRNIKREIESIVVSNYFDDIN